MSEIKLTMPGMEEINLGELTGYGAADAERAEKYRFAALSTDDQQNVEEFAKKIKIGETPDLATKYGIEAQATLHTFANQSLKGVTGRDIGDIGTLLAQMNSVICGFSDDFNDAYGDAPKKLSFLQKLKKKAITSREELKVRYSEVSDTLEGIATQLTKRHDELSADIAKMNEMYKHNLNYFRELNLYILAGQKALKEARENELQELQRKAQETRLPEDAQAYNDFRAKCESFDKRLFDLELTRSICLQTAPEIRLLQEMDEQTMQRISSAIMNTIPMWKHSIVIGLAINRGNNAAQMMDQVRDLTGKIFVANAERLKMASVETAKTAGEGYIDVKAVVKCNEVLISAIAETRKAYDEAQATREKYREKLAKSDSDLKNALIGVRESVA